MLPLAAPSSFASLALAPFAPVLAPRRMAPRTVVQLGAGDPFLVVLGANARWGMLVTFIAAVARKLLLEARALPSVHSVALTAVGADVSRGKG